MNKAGTKMVDEFKIAGQVDGLIIDHPLGVKPFIKDGKLFVPKKAEVKPFKYENLVVQGGRNLVARLMGQAEANVDPITKFATGNGAFLPGSQVLGTEPPPPLGTATTLKNEVFDKAITPANISFPNLVSCQYQILLEDTESNGYYIDEVGLFTDNNIMFSTRVFTPIKKIATRSILFIWTILY